MILMFYTLHLTGAMLRTVVHASCVLVKLKFLSNSGVCSASNNIMKFLLDNFTDASLRVFLTE